MRINLTNILCAIDFSEFSKQVMHHGFGLSHRFGSRLAALHTVPASRDQLYGAPVSQWGEDKKMRSEEARKGIDQLTSQSPVPCESILAFGDPVKEIARVAGERDADLVIAASHGISGLKRLIIGTVVERLARTLPRPLLVTRTTGRPDPSARKTGVEIGKIVVGCDFSASAISAVGSAAGLARKFHAELHLLHAMETPMDYGEKGADLVPYQEAQQMRRDQIIRRLSGLLPDKGPASVPLKPTVVPGIPGEALCALAREIRADLIVVGIRCQGSLEKLFIGSTTEAVLRRAPCSVLTIPSADPGAGKTGKRT
ncbi:MAG: universal stress protein [Desulfobacterales bacterium]|nr:universal stress protein [Desulfobacterales bacterium]